MSFRTSLSKMFAQLFSNPLTRGISLWEVLPRDRIISCCPLLSCLRPGLEPHLYWSPGVRGQILWFECKITSYHKLLFEHLFWVWKDYVTFRVRDGCGWKRWTLGTDCFRLSSSLTSDPSSLPPDPPNCEKVTPPTPATLTDRSPLPGWACAL